MSPKTHSHPAVMFRILEMADLTTAKHIREALFKEAAAPGAPFTVEDVPSERTIQRRVKELAALDGSGEWSVADAPLPEIRAVLPVLAWLVKESKGFKHRLSQAEAGLITRVRAALPDESPMGVWAAVLTYRDKRARGESDAWVTALIALQSSVPEEINEAGSEARDAFKSVYLKYAPSVPQGTYGSLARVFNAMVWKSPEHRAEYIERFIARYSEDEKENLRRALNATPEELAAAGFEPLSVKAALELEDDKQ